MGVKRIFHAYVVKRHTFTFLAAVCVYDPSFFIVNFCWIWKNYTITYIERMMRVWWFTNYSELYSWAWRASSRSLPGCRSELPCPSGGEGRRGSWLMKNQIPRHRRDEQFTPQSQHCFICCNHTKSPEWESVIQP